MAAWAVKAALLLLWFGSMAFYAISAYCLSSFFKRSRPGVPQGGLPPLTVLKPVRGADEDSYDNLSSFVRQDYPAFQVLFGVASPDDPAARVIGRIMREHPEADIELVVSGGPVGPNLKVSNLHYMDARAKYDILVIADADMRVGSDYLASVASGFADDGVGLVTCPYRGAYPGDAGSALEALTINTDFLPSVTVAERLEGLSFALGATMAVRREALESIGGFTALSGYLADDYQLGNKVMESGYRLVLSHYVVDSVTRRESVKGFFVHQLRWGRTYRVSRPAGYFMSGITRGTAISLLFLAATGFSGAGWLVVFINLAARWMQAYYTEALYVNGPGVLRWLWLLPVRDLLGFAVWLLSFTGGTVSWKDEKYSIGRDGRMVRI